MTRTEQQAIYDQYHERFGVGLSLPPLDFGYRLKVDQLCEYAQAAIAANKPINWREVLGPTLHEIDPMLVS